MPLTPQPNPNDLFANPTADWTGEGGETLTNVNNLKLKTGIDTIWSPPAVPTLEPATVDFGELEETSSRSRQSRSNTDTLTGAAALTTFSLASASTGNTIYGNAGTDLKLLDLTSGTSTSIGTLRFSTSAIARQTETGRIYYVYPYTDPNNPTQPADPRLAYWDPNAANPFDGATANTLVGSLGVSIPGTPAKLSQAPANTTNPSYRNQFVLLALTKAYRIDPNIGAATSIGTVTTPNPAHPTFFGGGGDVAFDPQNPDRLFVTQGVAVGGGSLGTGTGTIQLYSIDINTQEASYLGDTGLSYLGGGGLDFGPDGQLYVSSQGLVYRIDRTNGSRLATLPGNATTWQFNDFAGVFNPDLNPPTVTARLSVDTGTVGDLLTGDPGIQGTVSDADVGTKLEARFGSSGSWVNVTSALSASGTFTLTKAQLETVYGAALVDGAYQLELQATDAAGNRSPLAAVSFTLDATQPTVIFGLAGSSDTQPVGDGKTSLPAVTVVGQTEANAVVKLVQTGTTVTADATGKFQLDNVPLVLGNNSVTLEVTDKAGNVNTVTQVFTRTESTQASKLYGTVGNKLHLFDSTATGATSTVVGTLLFPSAAIATNPASGRVYYVEKKTVTTSNVSRVGYFDPATGTNVELGSISLFNPNTTTLNTKVVGKLAFVPADANNPALANSLLVMAESDKNLYRYDLATGTTTALGTINTTNAPALSGGTGDIALDPTDSNRLYVTQALATPATVQLYRIDLALKRATYIGDTGLSRTGAGGLSFGTDGELYVSSGGKVYPVNRATGAVGTPVSGTLNVTYEDFAPWAVVDVPPVVAVRLAADTGSSSTDGMTRDATVTGTITDSTPVDQFAVSLDGTTDWRDAKAFLNADGSFALTPAQLAQVLGAPLADGPQTLHFRAVDRGGNLSAPVSLAFNLDTVAPPLALQGGAPTANPTVTLVGTTAPGQVVSLDGTALTATADAAGAYSFAGVPLNLGANSFTVRATDAAGNVAAVTQSFTRTEALDTTRPVVAARLAVDTGSSATDRLTSNPAVAGTVVDASPISLFRMRLDPSTSAWVDAKAFLNADGTFALSRAQLETAFGRSLGDGQRTIWFQARDSQNNLSTAVSLVFSLDTAAPPLALALDAASDTAPVGDGQTTLSSVTLVGTTAPGQVVSLEGTGLTATADAAGAYSFAGVPLNLGANSFAVRATDAAGNAAVVTQVVTRVAVPDTTPPVVAVRLAADTGSSATDRLTSNPAVAGTVVDASPISTFEMRLTSTGFTSAWVSAKSFLNADGTFALSQAQLEGAFGRPLAQGAQTFQFRARDAQNNLSATTSLAINLDTVAPPLALGLDPAFDTEQPGDGQTTRTGVTLVGTTEPGRVVSLDGTGLTATADAAGAYSFAGVPLNLGANPFTVRTVDAAGNATAADLILTRTAAQSSKLYGTVGDKLHLFDSTATGATSTVVGTLPYPSAAIATDAASGRVYYVEKKVSSNVSRLGYFDPTGNTPETRNIELGSMALLNMSGVANRNGVGKLAYVPANAGTALANSLLLMTERDSILYKYDLAAGTVAALGTISTITNNDTSIPRLTGGAGDIALDPSNPNRLFATQVLAATTAVPNPTVQLYSVDLATRRATYLGDTGLSGVGAGGLSFGTDGELYLSSGGKVYPVNRTTAAAGSPVSGTLNLGYEDFAPWVAPDDGYPPVVAVALANDTGSSSTDAITRDATVTGTVTDLIEIDRFEVALGEPTAWKDAKAFLNADGSFTLTPAQLAQVLGASLTDGAQTLYFRAADKNGNRSEPVALALTLDTVVSVSNFGLYSGSDTGELGDDKTDIASVWLEGQAELGSTVTLQPTGLSATVDGTYGTAFYLGEVPLEYGNNPFSLQVTDVAGNQVQVDRTFFRNPVIVSPNPNRPPLFISTPIVDAVAGTEYRYPVKTLDEDGNSLVLSLDTMPEGMVLDAEKSELVWTPFGVQAGLQDVAVSVSDGLASAQQRFQVRVRGPVDNYNPIIVSAPDTLGGVGGYVYDVRALEPDGDELTYKLLNGPAGMVFDATTPGRLRWDAPVAGESQVEVAVYDGKGGVDTQKFTLNVQPGVGSIAGRIWDDANSSGVQDEGESSLDGIEVYLDANENDIVDAGEARVLTNERGEYRFDDLQPGKYPVKANWSEGMVQTFPPVQEFLGDSIAIDGSFEVMNKPPIQGPNYEARPAFFYPKRDVASAGYYQNWTVFGDSVSPWVWGQYGGVWYLPSSGSYFLDLHGYDHSGVYQDIPTVPGKAYRVGFDIGKHPWGHNPGLISSSAIRSGIWGTATGYTFGGLPKNGPNSWENRTWDFTATNDTTRIYFHSTSGGNPPPAIDNVTVLPILGYGAFYQAVVTAGRTTDNLNFGGTQPAPPELNSNPVITSEPTVNDKGISILAEDRTFTYQATATDSDNDTLTYSLSVKPDGMAVDSRTGRIVWEPKADQLNRRYDVMLKVEDERGAGDWQWFTVDTTIPELKPEELAVLPDGIDKFPISPDPNNEAPVITTEPRFVATVGETYRYAPEASDPENDRLMWQLDVERIQPPVGMKIDPATKTLVWTPTVEQIGKHTVAVRVIDTAGNFVGQEFELTVRGANTPPTINSSPIATATAGKPYRSLVRATDADGDSLAFSLLQQPEGMTIDPLTGEIRWTPDTPGTHAVRIQVEDERGAKAVQDYTLSAGEPTVNQHPAIVSTPVHRANTGSEYRYRAIANDPDGDRLYYFLQSAPEGMRIDSATGEITWNPTAAQVGEYTVDVAAVDPYGAGAGQRFLLTALENPTPTVNSTPKTQIAVGVEYKYDIHAYDIHGDKLSYNLASGPEGMTLDEFGRLRWTPTAAGNYPVSLEILDEFGGKTLQNFTLAAIRDTQAPTVDLKYTLNFAKVGQDVTFAVQATDDIGPITRSLTFNGNPVPLDRNNWYTHVFDAPGLYQLEATATDAAGNTSTKTLNYQVSAANSQAPAVNILPLSGPITTATPILGQVSDSDGDLQGYKLEIAPAGTENWRTLTEGSGGIDGAMATLDPSTLPNDVYRLKLTANDVENTVWMEREVEVASELKLGNFTLSFTDLEIPLSGIPIQVVRRYDTLDVNQQDDFSYGWRLEFRDTNLRTNLGPDEVKEELGIPTVGFREGQKVYLTEPGGKRVGFTFRAKHDPLNRFLLSASAGNATAGIYYPQFIPDKGVKSKLEIDSSNVKLQVLADGRYVSLGTGIPYNPADPTFGKNLYTLTMKNGIKYTIDGLSGDLLTAADTNGNQLTYSENEIVSNSGVRVTFGRDGLGRITSVTDPAGESITYGYTGDDLTSVTDRDENATQFTYHSSRPHFMKEVIDPLGRTGIRAEYDEAGRLKEMFDADGGKVEFVYEPENYIERVKDPYGKETVYEYTNEGNIIEEIHPNGKRIERQFDDRNNVLFQTETTLENGQSKSRRTSYTYDGLDNKLTETDPLGNTSRYSYGNYGRLQSETDPLGNTTTYGYDPKGNLLWTVDPNGSGTSFGYDGKGNLIALTNAKGQSTSFSYDGKGNVLSVISHQSSVISYGYDANGNRTSETQTVTTPTGTQTLVTRWDYSDDGKLLSTTDPTGYTTTYTYDGNGNQIEVKDALNRITKSRYDDKGQLVEAIYPDATPTDADNPRTVTVYDRGGRQRATLDESGRVTHYRYNSAGDLIETIYPKDGDTLAQFVTAVAPGKIPLTVDWTQVVYPDEVPAYLASHPRTKTEYSPSGEVLAEIDERGNRTEFAYDDAGRKSVISHQSSVISYEYDAAGRRIAAVDGLGNETRFTHDATGRVVGTQFDDGTKTETEYDTLGRRVKSTDAEGNETKYEYDGLGRLKAVVQFLDGRQIRTSYGYDELGRMVWQEDAKGNRTNYEYDGNGRRTAVVLPEGQRSVSTYDAVGNLKTQKDFNGITTGYIYDERNRLKGLDLPGTAEDVGYTYTPTGNRQTVADGRGTTTYAYDARERLVSRIDPAGTSPALASGKTIEYGYDDAGNVVEVKTAAGTTTSGYDAQNRLAAVTDAGKTTQYVYDLAGNLAETQLPNGVVEKRTYDGLNRLAVLENVKGTEVLSRFEYTLDDSGNRTEVRESVKDALTGMLVVRTVRYGYDDLYRLSSETVTYQSSVNSHQSSVKSWTYDDVGNRLSQTDSAAGTTAYSYDKNDRLLSESGATNATYAYDNNGNTRTVTQASEVTNYTWDNRNRMTQSVNSQQSSVIGYTYDDENIRTSSTVGNETTRFVVDGNRDYAQVLAEYRGGSLQASYTYGLDLVSQKRGGTESFYLVDGLGSTRGLTDATGNLTDTYTYDSFGNLVGSAGSTSNSYLFAGEQYDSNLDQYYLRQRLYDAGTGRFTRRDVFEGSPSSPITLHKYLYGNGNPVTYIDPSGLYSTTETSATFSIGNILQNVYRVVSFVDKIYEPEPLGGFGSGPQPRVPNHTGGSPVGEVISRLRGFGEGVRKPNTDTEFFPTNTFDDLISYLFSSTSSNAKILRQRMEAEGEVFNPGDEAHHIVPSTHSEGQWARAVLESYGINVNDAVNGVRLTHEEHHQRGLHTHEAIHEVVDRVLRAESKEAIENELRQIANEIRRGRFP